MVCVSIGMNKVSYLHNYFQFYVFFFSGKKCCFILKIIGNNILKTTFYKVFLLFLYLS